MTTTTFTPAQHTLHDALTSIDRSLLIIARDVMAAWMANSLDTGPDPEDLGAPVDSPARVALEDAFGAFEDAASGSDEEKTRVALDVTNTVLAAKR